MYDSDYEQLVGNATELTRLFIEFNDVIQTPPRVKTLSQQQDDVGPWEELADAVEIFTRTLVNDFTTREW